MMLQKKLNASWTTKIRSFRMRSDDAGAHDQKQYAPDNGESADTRNKALPPSGLRTEMELPGTYLGLSLSRVPL